MQCCADDVAMNRDTSLASVQVYPTHTHTHTRTHTHTPRSEREREREREREEREVRCLYPQTSRLQPEEGSPCTQTFFPSDDDEPTVSEMLL